MKRTLQIAVTKLKPIMNPPLLHHSHDEGSLYALKSLLLAICAWNLLYLIFQYLITRYSNWILDDSLNDSKKNEVKQNLIKRGPSYATSQVHAVYASYRGILHLYDLSFASNLDKVFNPRTHILDGIQTTRWAGLEVATTNILFLSYLLYDLLHVIYQYPKLGGIDTILHHILFAMCSVINGTYGIMPYPFGWLVVGEISTIFLNVRWFLLKSGREDSKLLNATNRLFALAFFVTRNFLYTIGMVHLFWFSWDEVQSLPEVSGVPRVLSGMTQVFIFLGWGLNVVWGYKILNMVMGVGKKKKSV